MRVFLKGGRTVAVMALIGSACLLQGQETDLAIHDPSTLIKQGSAYWVFGTGPGCTSFSSTDRIHWTFRGSVFSARPSWVEELVPKKRDNSCWAPDVRHVRDKYYLYYSVSTFGSNVSAIGLATSANLEPAAWVDQGVVIRSQARDNFNAIDPAVIQTPGGKLWLVFGSFWSGIKLIELNPATGLRTAPDSPMYALAAHPQEHNNAIEAPFLHYHRGYYYLFVNWDYCCRGNKSTYNIRVGRSKQITGPYLDKAGVDLLKGGGTLVLGSAGTSDSSAPPNDKIGPGHAGILTENGVDRFSFHYEFVRAQGGKPMLELGIVDWGRDGWPKIVMGK